MLLNGDPQNNSLLVEPFFYIYSSGYRDTIRVDPGTEGILRIELKKVSPVGKEG